MFLRFTGLRTFNWVHLVHDSLKWRWLWTFVSALICVGVWSTYRHEVEHQSPSGHKPWFATEPILVQSTDARMFSHFKSWDMWFQRIPEMTSFDFFLMLAGKHLVLQLNYIYIYLHISIYYSFVNIIPTMSSHKITLNNHHAFLAKRNTMFTSQTTSRNYNNGL